MITFYLSDLRFERLIFGKRAELSHLLLSNTNKKVIYGDCFGTITFDLW